MSIISKSQSLSELALKRFFMSSLLAMCLLTGWAHYPLAQETTKGSEDPL